MNTQNFEKLKDLVKRPLLNDNPNSNITKSERVLSLAAGAFIAFHGVKNIFSHPIIAMGELATGGLLMQRGITGKCMLKEMAEDCACEENTTVIISEPQGPTL